MEIDKKSVGSRIKQIRLSLGYTQKEFVKLIYREQKSAGHAHNWEAGYNLPNPKALADIAFYGQISVDELLYGTDTNTSIMHDFIKWVEEDMFIEADKEFELGSTSFYSEKHMGAKELALRFIQGKLGGNINE